MTSGNAPQAHTGHPTGQKLGLDINSHCRVAPCNSGRPIRDQRTHLEQDSEDLGVRRSRPRLSPPPSVLPCH